MFINIEYNSPDGLGLAMSHISLSQILIKFHVCLHDAAEFINEIGENPVFADYVKTIDAWILQEPLTAYQVCKDVYRVVITPELEVDRTVNWWVSTLKDRRQQEDCLNWEEHCLTWGVGFVLSLLLMVIGGAFIFMAGTFLVHPPAVIFLSMALILLMVVSIVGSGVAIVTAVVTGVHYLNARKTLNTWHTQVEELKTQTLIDTDQARNRRNLEALGKGLRTVTLTMWRYVVVFATLITLLGGASIMASFMFNLDGTAWVAAAFGMGVGLSTLGVMAIGLAAFKIIKLGNTVDYTIQQVSNAEPASQIAPQDDDHHLAAPVGLVAGGDPEVVLRGAV